MTTRRRLSIQRLSSLIAAILLTGYLTSSALAQNSESVIPLEGLDPVMLSQGKEVQGDMKFSVTRGQFKYIFSSEENKATFEKEPARYEIELEGFCARMGAPTGGNPDLYAVHQGRIYIFGSPECQKLFTAAPEKYLETPAPPKSSTTAEMIKRGQELVAKAVEVLGGKAILDQLVSFQKKDVRGNDIKNVLLLSFPDTIRQEVIRPTFTLVSVVTPTESFVAFNNSVNPMSEANRTFILQNLNHEPVLLLRARTRSDFKVSASGSDKVGETAIERVEIELPGFTTTLGIDPATGRVLSQKYHGRGPGGVVGDVVINYSDFRSVEGLSLPFKIDATFDGQPHPALTATIEAVTINGQIDPASFKKPAPRQ